MNRDVFHAIADPNRRRILNLLARRRLTLNGVARNFRISRPAVSKHVRILREAGLVVVTKHGRQRFCESRIGRLDEVSKWLDRYRDMWNARFDRLEDLITEE